MPVNVEKVLILTPLREDVLFPDLLEDGPWLKEPHCAPHYLNLIFLVLDIRIVLSVLFS
jgi:hypothetical protein